MSKITDRHCIAVVVIFASALLAGCSAQGDSDRVGSFMVAPGKYDLYTCAHLAAQMVTLQTRERELDALIARAGVDSGGRLVSAIAYRPEHIQTRGYLIEVRKAEAAKNCPPQASAVPPQPAATAKPKKR